RGAGRGRADAMAAEPLGKRLSALCPPALARLPPTGPQPKRVQPPGARPAGRALLAGTAAEPAAGPDSGERPAPRGAGYSPRAAAAALSGRPASSLWAGSGHWTGRQ